MRGERLELLVNKAENLNTGVSKLCIIKVNNSFTYIDKDQTIVILWNFVTLRLSSYIDMPVLA